MQVTAAEGGTNRSPVFSNHLFSDIYVGAVARSADYDGCDTARSRRLLSAAFGISREQNARKYIPGERRTDPDVPGPGSYNPLKPLGYDSKKFSMSPKDKSRHLEATPGPGAYEPRTELSSTGKYFFSRYQNSRACVFSPKSSVRFKPGKNREDRLGPGVYRPKLEMNTTGTYFFSQFRSSQVSKFSRTPRDAPRKSLTTPGPGTYQLPTSFQLHVSRHLLQQ